MAEKIFEYCGDPDGFVPGLPATITEREAKTEGKWDLLQAAISAGNYRMRDDPAPANLKKQAKGE
jgi:hypothetical protein